MAWHHLQYVAGLAALGHDVYFFEDSDDYDSCYHPATESMDSDPQYGLRFAERAFRKLGLSERWAYFDEPTACWLGPARSNAREIARSADLLLNVSAVN